MKKGTKGMLIAAGAFAVAGIGFCIGGISVAQWKQAGMCLIRLDSCFRIMIIRWLV